MPTLTEKAESSVGLPFVEELQSSTDPVAVFLKLKDLPHCLFLDSALTQSAVGRYSFIVADPFDFLTVPADGSEGLELIRERLNGMKSEPVRNLPPFQGGAAGLLGYELGQSFERLPAAAIDEFQVPALAIGFYDVVVAFDHSENRVWLISHGFPETTTAARTERAVERLKFFRTAISGKFRSAPITPETDEHWLHQDQLRCPHEVAEHPGLFSNYCPRAYKDIVQRAIDYIHAGDVFQVNIAQRLLCRTHDDPISLYLRLRQRNPAPFAGYFDLGTHQIVSASPERFLSVRDGLVEARPIKGTRRRFQNPVADLFSGSDLLESDKDRAENVMIVDLLRNDLARVCLPDSVRVTKLCGLEVYEFVQHLVSVIQGRLAPNKTPIDLIRAAFPGGSITGAPKVRAMEIISELESTARGAYCGSLGYIGFDGTTDLSILIRTITAGCGWWQLPVGGGIVAQSDPQNEYEETWHKAVGLLRSLQ